MRLRFVGADGSMGLRHGSVYYISLASSPLGVQLTQPVICPYSSERAFWENWELPNMKAAAEARKEVTNLARHEAWREGYQACYEGKQRHSPYDPRKELRPDDNA